MAAQAQNATKGATNAAPGGLGDKVQSATTGLLGKIEGFGSWITGMGKSLLDRLISPEQRASLLAKLQAFMLKNPKLSAFMGMNIAITGVPLFLFILFTITVALFSLIVGLVLGLLAAVLFIVFAVGTALVVVLPTVFFTTMAACFLFLWGLGGFYILKWANGDKAGEPAPEGGAIGDKLNSLTGGRLTGFMDAAKGERAKGDIEGFNDQHTKPKHESGEKEKKPAPHHAQTNGTAEPHKEVGDVASKATKATGVDGAKNTAANATGTVKGGLSGATGLG
ncbi:hypothetical protein B0A55_11838 [Friedmanniomyces simplex]|uniref:Uncharacterized protein n=1 Tax=Friedmanniomyces simplex TaxID=329884 RepID=A0A4U0WGE3_9PEZI|nr:hypothetical protein B0A55_11838 [Friedmanniomyces simplex]